MKATYHTTCVSSDATSIINMVDAAREVTFRTFNNRCYLYDKEKANMRKYPRDYTFHKSVYRGNPCYYYVHSRIEHVYILGG